jgi:hypothetical protein
MNYGGFSKPLRHWLKGYQQGAWGMNDRITSPLPYTTEALAASWQSRLAAIPWAVALQQFNLLASHDTQRVQTQVGGNEALHRLASADEEDRRYYPTREETEQYLVPEQDKREIVDPWFERLAMWLDSKQQYGETGIEVLEVSSFTAFDLLTKCLMVPQDRLDGGRQMATRVGIAMHKLGWHKHRDSKGARLWRYWRPGHEPAQPGLTTDGAAGGPAVELHEF